MFYSREPLLKTKTTLTVRTGNTDSEKNIVHSFILQSGQVQILQRLGGKDSVSFSTNVNWCHWCLFVWNRALTATGKYTKRHNIRHENFSLLLHFQGGRLACIVLYPVRPRPGGLDFDRCCPYCQVKCTCQSKERVKIVQTSAKRTGLHLSKLIVVTGITISCEAGVCLYSICLCRNNRTTCST